MDGAIFFAPLLACLYSDSITLTALAASSFRGGGSGDFSLSPFPLPSALLCLRVSINPPPPGVGCANERAVCGCGRDGGLLAFIVSCRSLAERSFAFVLPDVRVFLSCLVSSLLTGSGLGGRRRIPSSFRLVSVLSLSSLLACPVLVRALAAWVPRACVLLAPDMIIAPLLDMRETGRFSFRVGCSFSFVLTRQ